MNVTLSNNIDERTIQVGPGYLPKGTRLSNRYRIECHLKSGGFGNTYMAIDERFNASVAIKELYIEEICGRVKDSTMVILSLGTNQKTFQSHKERFVKEAYRLFQFSHPNVVKVTDVFEENGTAYYVMEYIDGMSLQDIVMKYGSLTEDSLMPYLDQILSALNYVHSKGVLHLDLKPGNIMLDKSGRIVLIDFGASKQFESVRGNEKSSTLSASAYTVGYAAPEQTGSVDDKVGSYSDIYSLGATIYCLLSGVRPKSPNEIMNEGLPQIESISPMMRNVITAAMAYRINDRIQSVQKFYECFNVGSNLNPNPNPNPNPKYKRLALIAFIAIVMALGGYAISMINNNGNGEKTEKAHQIDSKEASEASVSNENLDDQDSETVEVESKIEPEKAYVAVHPMDNGFIQQVNNISFQMRKVDGGSFYMGATSEQDYEAENDEYPAHLVELSSYYIGVCEVTRELWMYVMYGSSKYNGDNSAVKNVTWNECQTFIGKLNKLTGKNYRLPTEAEWEYAARGGNMSNDYMYSGGNFIGDVAWYNGNSTDRKSVGQKLSNELGLYDMSGNVLEWCSDWYGEDYYSKSPTLNPRGPQSGTDKVMRGGSFYSSAEFCRVSNRGFFSPSQSQGGRVGLRLACSN